MKVSNELPFNKEEMNHLQTICDQPINDATSGFTPWFDEEQPLNKLVDIPVKPRPKSVNTTRKVIFSISQRLYKPWKANHENQNPAIKISTNDKISVNCSINAMPIHIKKRIYAPLTPMKPQKLKNRTLIGSANRNGICKTSMRMDSKHFNLCAYSPNVRDIINNLHMYTSLNNSLKFSMAYKRNESIIKTPLCLLNSKWKVPYKQAPNRYKLSSFNY